MVMDSAGAESLAKCGVSAHFYAKSPSGACGVCVNSYQKHTDAASNTFPRWLHHHHQPPGAAHASVVIAVLFGHE
jgi:hypothetical protein